MKSSKDPVIARIESFIEDILDTFKTRDTIDAQFVTDQLIDGYELGKTINIFALHHTRRDARAMVGRYLAHRHNIAETLTTKIDAQPDLDGLELLQERYPFKVETDDNGTTIIYKRAECMTLEEWRVIYDKHEKLQMAHFRTQNQIKLYVRNKFHVEINTFDNRQKA